MRLGLDHTRRLLAALGDPQAALRAVHIAGTNGKGSTTATVAALLAARGLRVGTYTSPHLIDFRERILVDGVPIAGDEVVEFVATWAEEIERIGATFFEATTAMALLHFARAAVDVAVIETGLGGRLDSTNVITPLVAVVTNIGLDHTEYLGDTVEAIAREKAGVFKPGVPAVIGERDPAVAAQLAAAAHAAGATPVRVLRDEGWPEAIEVGDDGTTFTVRRGGTSRRVRTPLVGRHQAVNTAVALLTLDALGAPYALADAELDAALARVRVAGRFERDGRYVFDVAHNPDGAATLARTLAAVAPPRPVVALLAVLSDKDWRAIMTTLAPQVDRFVLTTAPSAPANRRWDPWAALAYAGAQGWPAEVEPDFARAIARAEDGAETVLVTGSFHTVGDVMARLPAAPRAR
ncbi:MAG TPA: Mur ligase family protein [Gemmatimonadaceae bacterium]|nr:Mur ligase family protein [Gemmatimonadaceae bacterium]